MQLEVYIDSDWAGSTDRKSTSGGIICIEGAAIKHWSRTQKARALSSGEAEYYAVVTGSAEGLGAQSLATDLGWEFQCRIIVKKDSSVAKSVAGRRGLRRLRHAELKYLWVQEAVAKGRIAMKKISVLYNPADVLTKPKIVLSSVAYLAMRARGTFHKCLIIGCIAINPLPPTRKGRR